MTGYTPTGTTARSDGGTANGGRPPMGDVSHTDPEAAASLHRLYRRGEHVVADGGHAGARERTDDDRDEREDDASRGDDETARGEEMRAVDHTGEDDTDPNKVFERGGEFDEE